MSGDEMPTVLKLIKGKDYVVEHPEHETPVLHSAPRGPSDRELIRAWVEAARNLMIAATQQQRLSLEQRSAMKSLVGEENMNALALVLVRTFGMGGPDAD